MASASGRTFTRPLRSLSKGKDGKLVASEEKDYCGPMHRIDMPKENDINF